MVISGYILKIPYWITWQIVRAFRKEKDIAFYLGTVHDYYLIENILPHLTYPYRIVAKNKNIARCLRKKGIKITTWPAFPEVVITPRHAFHRFPIKAIKKIGMRHGPYHFKKMIDAAKYNAFDMYLFTSKYEVQQAEKLGIRCGVSGGYPRLDALRHKKTQNLSRQLKNTTFFKSDKPTLLFTATWKHSGMSAIDQWINHIEKLTASYNLMVSLHPEMPRRYYQKIINMKNIRLVYPQELPAAMLTANIMISDTSSVIAEFCALNKPIITFTVEENRRLTPEIAAMLDEISVQITHINQLENAINMYKKNPGLKASERNKWNQRFFDNVTASQSRKAAAKINTFLAENLV